MDNLEFEEDENSGDLVADSGIKRYWIIEDRGGATLELHSGDRAGPTMRGLGHYSSVTLAKRAANAFEGDAPMSQLEEDQPRFQGNDNDQFTTVDCIVYDQVAGEKMAARIETLSDALNDLLNDCINFDGGKLTDSIMQKASAALKTL